MNSLISGRSFGVIIVMSINIMLGRWSDMSVIKFPADTFVWIRFFGVLSNIWSKMLAEWLVILVGIVMHGIKEFCRTLFMYCSVCALFVLMRSIFMSPAITVRVLSFIVFKASFRLSLK